MINALDQTGLAYFWSKITGRLATKADLVNGKVPASQLPASGGGDGSAVPPMTEITWSALKALRDGGNLTPGMQYRITDYTTIVTGYYDLSIMQASGLVHYGTSAEHPFDVIVTADDESTLNENARAALHSGDTYFANNDLGAWELKYCIDNDATRFSFANSSGKGVIYYMKDEFCNEAGYDFKSWQFVRYALKLADATEDYTPVNTGLVYDATIQPNRYGSMYHMFMVLQNYMSTGSYASPFTVSNNPNAPLNYDFACGANILGALQMASIDATYKTAFNADLYYTFDYYDATNGVHKDLSLGGIQYLECRENKLALEVDMASASLFNSGEVLGVGGNVVETNSIFMSGQDGLGNTGNPIDYLMMINNNEFGTHNYMNTFGNSCNSNVFGNYCNSNVFGNYCNSNVFGNDCNSNVFGNDCNSNVFGNYCNSNVFGNDCNSNVFGNDCNSNVFGNYCYSNVFGNDCYSNVFGNSCYSNVFGNYCYSNVFGNSCYSNVFGNYCNSNVFGQSTTDNEFIGYVSRVIFKVDGCANVTIEPNGWVAGIEVEDAIDHLTLPTTQISGSNYRIENYSGTTCAILIHRTGYNTETAVSTTDGGTTWTAA